MNLSFYKTPKSSIKVVFNFEQSPDLTICLNSFNKEYIKIRFDPEQLIYRTIIVLSLEIITSNQTILHRTNILKFIFCHN